MNDAMNKKRPATSGASPDDLKKLWTLYLKDRDLEIRNELLVEYVPLVKRVVSRLFQSTKAFNEFDDLVSCGVLGLMDAMDRFDPAKGAQFETYAQTRIRGEVLDYMRSLDWAPVQMRIKIKKVSSAYDELSQAEGRMVTDEEVSQYLGISQTDLHEIHTESHFLNVVRLEEMLFETTSEDIGFAADNEIEINLEHDEFKQKLGMEIRKLTEKEQMVISLYYTDELTLKEIGSVLGLTESRVCQIHSSITAKLRGRMKYYR